MTGLNRKGFTLVELLVVVVIIAMLVGLTVPAVQNARERARQAQCTNNQHEIALAVLQYETAKKSFPGYVNKFGTTPVTGSSDPRPPLSWTTVIFPYLGNEPAWREWRELRRTDSNFAQRFSDLQVRVPQYLCPSDSDSQQDVAGLSYVANCGHLDVNNTPPDLAANGVFLNRYWHSTPTVTASTIRDGTAQTLMFSENIQAGDWFADPTPANSHVNEYNQGINWIWIQYADKKNPVEQPANAYSLINGARDVEQRPNNSNYARPSSNHPGGVIVTFCDGHQQFLSERILYATYQCLMASDDANASTIPAPSSPDSAGLRKPTDPELQVGQ